MPQMVPVDSRTDWFGRLLGWVHLEPLLAVIFWAGAISAAKAGVNEISVLSFTYIRLLMAAFLLLFLCQCTKGLRFPTFLWKSFLSLGLGQASFQFFFIAGLSRTSAGECSLMYATAPLMTVGWVAAWGGGKLHRRQWVGLVLGMVGVSVVVHGQHFEFSWGHLGGNLMCICSAAGWTLYTVAISRPIASLGTLQATGWATAVAAAMLTPICLPQIVKFEWLMISWKAWGGLFGNVVLGMVSGITLWGLGVFKHGAENCSAYLYLEPFFALLIAAILLGEDLTIFKGAGAVLTVFAVWLASGQGGKKRYCARTVPVAKMD